MITLQGILAKLDPGNISFVQAWKNVVLALVGSWGSGTYLSGTNEVRYIMTKNVINLFCTPIERGDVTLKLYGSVETDSLLFISIDGILSTKVIFRGMGSVTLPLVGTEIIIYTTYEARVS